MKLPDIEYGAPVQRLSDDIPRLDEAQRRAAATVQEGLTRYGMALVKTEAEEAQAHLATGLAQLEQDLTARRYVSTKELRQVFGEDLSGLDPNLRARVQTPGPVQADRDDIPTWEVAGAIFEKRSKELLAEAAKRVSGRGWRSEFEAAAAQDVLARKTRLAGVQLQAMDADLRMRADQVASELTRAGAFDAARASIESSPVLEPAEKEARLAAVEKARQLQPLEQRLLMGVETTADVVEAGKLIQRLESGEGLDQLEDKERIEWKRRLEAEVAHFETLSKAAVEKRFAAADEAARNEILTAYMNRKGRPLPMALAPKPGTVSPGVLEWSIKLIESTAPGAQEIKTDLRAYAELSRLAAGDPAKFKTADLSPYFGRLSVPDAKHFLDLQRTLKAEGPDSAKYRSFMGPQEETDLELVKHGFHVQGKDAEDDALAVGYVQREVNRTLWQATVLKARKGQGTELTPDEQTAIVVPLVARLVAAKGWKAEAAGSSVEPVYQIPIRGAAAALGKPPTPKSLEGLRAEFGAWENDIVTGWREAAGDTVLVPADAVGVFTVLMKHQAQIDEALTAEGKPLTSTNRARMAAGAYLRGVR